jgi:hypothetical protein
MKITKVTPAINGGTIWSGGAVSDRQITIWSGEAVGVPKPTCKSPRMSLDGTKLT